MVVQLQELAKQLLSNAVKVCFQCCELTKKLAMDTDILFNENCCLVKVSSKVEDCSLWQNVFSTMPISPIFGRFLLCPIIYLWAVRVFKNDELFKSWSDSTCSVCYFDSLTVLVVSSDIYLEGVSLGRTARKAFGFSGSCRVATLLLSNLLVYSFRWVIRRWDTQKNSSCETREDRGKPISPELANKSSRKKHRTEGVASHLQHKFTIIGVFTALSNCSLINNKTKTTSWHRRRYKVMFQQGFTLVYIGLLSGLICLPY